MYTRESLHQLIDSLPECDLEMAGQLIEWRHELRDNPLLVTLATAPWDDEPETPEEAAAVAEAREDVAAGRLIPHEEVRRRLLELP
jgi:hypothetical protein